MACSHGVKRKSHCKPCAADYMREWQSNNRAKVNGYNAKTRAKHKAAGLTSRGKPRAGRTGRRPLLSPEQRRANIRMHVARNNRRVRDEVHHLLGNRCKCVSPIGCAGDDMIVAQIDHINGDGFKHRKRGKGSHGVYKDLREYGEDFVREKYQLLCANCHVRKTLAAGDHRPKTMAGAPMHQGLIQ